MGTLHSKEDSSQALKEEVHKIRSVSCNLKEETSEHLDLESRKCGHQGQMVKAGTNTM